MDLADEFLKALKKIENDRDLTRDQWNEAIEEKVRELIEKYRAEYPPKNNTQ